MKEQLKLKDIPKHNVHRVPEGYFDRLPMRIMARTEQAVAPAPAVWLALPSRMLRFAVAPLLLLLCFAGVYLLGLQKAPAPAPVSTSMLTTDEIVTYLDMYAQVTTDDLEEHLEADQLIAADFLNVSPTAAEEELYYYPLDDIDF